MCIGISIIIFIGVSILGFQTHSWNFFNYFIPFGTPDALVPLVFLIEILSYFSRAFSLGVRLAANITSGHLIINLISNFLNNKYHFLLGTFFILPIFFYFWVFSLEIIISIIQAYIFSILTCVYIKDAIDIHLYFLFSLSYKKINGFEPLL